jgi:hypothetical protein
LSGEEKKAINTMIVVLEAGELIWVVRGTSADGTKHVNFYKLITRHDYNKTK